MFSFLCHSKYLLGLLIFCSTVNKRHLTFSVRHLSLMYCSPENVLLAPGQVVCVNTNAQTSSCQLPCLKSVLGEIEPIHQKSRSLSQPVGGCVDVLMLDMDP